MATRPTIAITGPERGGYPAWLFTSWAVRFAGGRPCRVTPSRPAPSRFDGLIVGGGADVAPGQYGATGAPPLTYRRRSRSLARAAVDIILAPLIYLVRRALGVQPSSLSGHDTARDAMELALLARAERLGTPVLGICRGAQLLNVYAGGTLHQNVAGFYVERSNRWTVLPQKRVAIEPESHLAAALGRCRCEVNSLHRQAVDTPGTELTVVARDGAGVVQAIEHPARSFWIGVQWHPEYLPQVPEQRLLLRRLVDAARANAALLPACARALASD